MLKHETRIGVIGRACRLPGANSVPAFWDLLQAGRCSVTEIPEGRWARRRFYHPERGRAGKSYTFRAGVLDDIWGFDATIFGISPREAAQMDPQQRILLEVVWDALENANIRPASLSGEHIGVYVGASALDHGNRRLFDPASADAYLMTGNTLSLVSNRISYAFDLRGPSLTVDTACSSSLVALHEACEAIRLGTIDTAIVAGANILLSPFPFVGFAAASMLSPEGLCRAFDADGQGYVRAEGCVAVVLRRVDPAFPGGAGRRPFVEIAATGVNSDGRTSGVALPSPERQAALLERVYKRAGVAPNDLAFVEAHGTGTPVGDPVEAQALGRVLGMRRQRKLLIGSVKTNIGHLEPVSGLAGLLKASLALEHRLLPASLHFNAPNPDIAFDDLNLEVASTPRPLLRGDEPRFAGISTFGFGGTNAHVILRDPDVSTTITAADAAFGALEPKDRQRAAPLIVLSARTPAAVTAIAGNYADELAAHTDLSPSETHPADPLAASVWAHRERLPERIAAIAPTMNARAAALGAFSRGEANVPGIVRGRAAGDQLPVAFVFSGNGAQWPGMGRAAYDSSPAFRAAFDKIDRCFESVGGWSLRDMLRSDELETSLERTEIAQPLLYAIHIALARALRSHGIVPHAVLGHSVGEVAAAQISGALTLEQGVRIIHARSTCQENVRGAGTMAALALSSDEAARVLRDGGHDAISIAAVNSTRSVTLSGSHADIEAFVSEARSAGWPCKHLNLDYPFHSPLIEPVKAPLAKALAGLNANATDIPFISTVTGSECAGEDLAAPYWWRNVREQVRFAEAINAAADMGCRVFLEIGPRPILRNYITDILRDRRPACTTVTSLDKAGPEDGDPVSFALARVIVAGAAFDPDRVFAARPDRDLDLPRYPWQRSAYETHDTPEALTSAADRASHHPLLGWRSSQEELVWHNHLDTHVLDYATDHRVGGAAVLPGAAFAEIVLEAARLWFGHDRVEIRDMDIALPLILENEQMRELRTRISPDTGAIDIASRVRLSEDAWQVHVSARIAAIPGALDPVSEAPRRHCKRPACSADQVYAAAAARGLDYGPHFRRLARAEHLSDNEIGVWLTGEEVVSADNIFHGVDPIALDACFHGLFSLYETGGAGGELAHIPIRFARLRLLRPAARLKSARIFIRRSSARSIQADFHLYDTERRLAVVLEGARFQAANLSRRKTAGQTLYGYRAMLMALPGCPVEPANLGADPVAILQAAIADRVSTDAGTENEARLLMEAAAIRTAYDAAGAFAEKSHGLSQTALDGLDPDRRTRVIALLRTLERASLAEWDESGWTLTPDCPYPPRDELIRAILADHPDWSAESVLLARAADALIASAAHHADAGASAERASGPEEKSTPESLPESAPHGPFSPATLEHLSAGSPAAQAREDVVVAVAEQAVAAASPDRPLRILEIGGRNAALSRRLAAMLDPAFATLTIVTDDNRLAERAKLRFETSLAVEVVSGSSELAAANAGPFDLVVASLGLHAMQNPEGILQIAAEWMRPNARLFALEAAPDAFHDVVLGCLPGWFDQTSDPEFPIGALRTQSEWQHAVDSTGLVDARCETVFCAGLPTLMISGARDPDSDRGSGQPSGEGATNAPSPRPAQVLGFGATTKQNATPLAAAINARMGGPDRDGVTPVRAVRDADAAGDADVELICVLEHDDPAALVHDLGDFADLLKAVGSQNRRIWIVAPGGSPLASRSNPTAAALWGLARTVQNEYSNLDIRLIDAMADMTHGKIAASLQSLRTAPGDEREVCLGERIMSALRIVPGLPQSTGQGASADAKADACGNRAITLGTPTGVPSGGRAERLRWQSVPRRTPTDNQVEIEIAATGLNFRDLMWSMGMLPEEALEDGFAGPTLGFEGAGRVVACGPDVKTLAPGDPVICVAPACFSSHVTVAENAVARLPDDVPLEAAATIPVAFLTVYYALAELARIEAGETVLIHGGAGGAGLAALQVAKLRGALVIATAGTEEKRSFLTAMGADHVLDSRSLGFSDAVKAITGGEGVDVVLNSLAGEAMELSLNLLKPFGRFLELGKRDYYANTRIGLRPFRRNVTYYGIDSDQLLAQRPDLAARLLRELMGHFASGDLTPLPYRTFRGEAVEDGFRLMQQSGHIGKILVTPAVRATTPDHELAAGPGVNGFEAAPTGTHIVIGGLGGFGLEVARWLAGAGARTIVLTSRGGIPDAGARDAIDALNSAGVRVRAVACDVTDRTAVDALLDTCRGDGPIRGVVHAAMVLEDGLISGMDRDAIARVLAPKVQGAEHLDVLTRHDQLDYFVLFSSVTALLGNPGQASYVAANAYLEGLARRRFDEGLPALAVGWGAITDVGYLARNADTADQIAKRTGGHAFRAADALAILSRLLANPHDAGPVVVAAPMDWSTAAAALPLMATPAYTLLARQAAHGGSPGSQQLDLAAEIDGLDESAAADVLAGHLRIEVARILRMPGDEIDVRRPLSEIGLDSLMGMELRTAAQQNLGLDVPIASVSDDLNIREIALRMVSRVRGGGTEPATEYAERESVAGQHLNVDLDADAAIPLAREFKQREETLKKVM